MELGEEGCVRYGREPWKRRLTLGGISPANPFKTKGLKDTTGGLGLFPSDLTIKGVKKKPSQP